MSSSWIEILEAIEADLANGTDGLGALKSLIDAVNVDIGDYSGQGNLQSLLAALGIPDTSGKPLYTVLVTDRLDNGTYGLNALKALIDTANTTLEHGTHGLAALETLVDSLETWLGDPSGGTLATITAKFGDMAKDLDTLFGTRWDASGDLGTDIASLLTLNDSKVMGRLQVVTTTWDLLRAGGGAGTDDIWTGDTQAVVLESLVARMPLTADVTDGDPITSMAIATDDAEPGIIIPAADAGVADMTPEAQFAWTGSLYIPTGTKIQGTIAGGDADAGCLVIVTATYRAVVSGGYLA